MSAADLARAGARYLEEAGGVGDLDDVLAALAEARIPAPEPETLRRYLNAAVQRGLATKWPGDAGLRWRPVFAVAAFASSGGTVA